MIEKLVNELKVKKLTMASMESCTGGALVNAITNIEGASEILKFSAVTYSNEFKIKMGVAADTIKKYSVYSIETAQEMAYNITKFTQADIGVGITGKINRKDENNDFGLDNEVFVSIYYLEKYYNFTLIVDKDTREHNKNMIVDNIVTKILSII